MGGLMVWLGGALVFADPVLPGEGDPAAELATCEAHLSDGPVDRVHARCQRRVPWLRARQDADGSFTGLRALSEVRQQYTTLPRAEAIARVADIFAGPQTAGALRLEAGLWLAREHLDVQGAPADALAVTEALWDEHPEDRAVADLHARALAGVGRIDEARAVEEAASPIRGAAPQEGLPLLLRQQRRDRLAGLSLGVLGVFAVCGLPGAARGWRKARLIGLIPLLAVVAAFAGLAALREPETVSTFGLLAVGLAAVHLLASAATAGAPRWRAPLSLLAGLASLAAGLLALYQTNQLGSIGL